jgi:dTDP-4-dehydrorhamnose 3,5-epimerase-like enzyme
MPGFSTLNDVRLTTANSKVAENGSLYVYQAGEQISFPSQRVFTVHADRGVLRGGHAHRKCWQALSCQRGSCLVRCRDDEGSVEIELSAPGQVLTIPPEIWAEQEYLEDGTVLMVLCDQPYDENDYVREWDDFLAWRSTASAG